MNEKYVPKSFLYTALKPLTDLKTMYGIVATDKTAYLHTYTYLEGVNHNGVFKCRFIVKR